MILLVSYLENSFQTDSNGCKPVMNFGACNWWPEMLVMVGSSGQGVW